MPIEYWAVLGRAWRRMTVLLFRPFDLVKWLTLALCAWLARLFDGGGGNGRVGGGHGGSVNAADLRDGLRQAIEGLGRAWEWVTGHWGATVVVFVGVPLLLGIVLTVLWLSSRFKLIYLDNLVQRRADIVLPWRRLGKLGDSLFVFRVGFGLVCLVIAATLVALVVGLGVFSLAGGANAWGIAGIVFWGLLFLAFVIVVAYLGLFLESFVVPIMYRHNLTAIAAWRAFLPWLSAQTTSFLLYGLFVLLLFVVTVLGIGVVGLATCCVGFVLLALPYVGTVLLLPLIVTYRYLSLEFLAQFHPSLTVFPVAPGEEVRAD